MAADYKVEYSLNGPRPGFSATGGLLVYGGKLYGTTMIGGGCPTCKDGCGTLFSFDPLTGAEAQLYAFTGGTDGASPNAGLIELGGKLYGTTLRGGSANCHGGCGTVFSLDPSTGAETVEHAFTLGDDGAFPESGLVQFGTVLYGATLDGGTASQCEGGCGRAYSLDPVSGVEKVLYDFQGTGDGAYPWSGLTKFGALLYGTALAAGPLGGGTVFSLDPKTGTDALVYAFKGRRASKDGFSPYGGLLKVGDLLYGTPASGADTTTIFAATAAASYFHCSPQPVRRQSFTPSQAARTVSFQRLI